MILKDDEEIEQLERKLGIRGKKAQLVKEMEKDGFDEDLFSFLDNIDTISKNK